MHKRLLLVVVLATSLGATAQVRDELHAMASSAAVAAAPAADAATLRAAFDAALWPADIVRAADAYLGAHPGAPDATGIAAQRTQAAEVMQLLRARDLFVYRSNFTLQDAALQRELRLAALGDRAAAVKLALASRAHDEAHGTRRYVGWMQLASLLRDAEASYELALYFRRSGQPVMAARYEAVALALGHEPLPALDNIRK